MNPDGSSSQHRGGRGRSDALALFQTWTIKGGRCVTYDERFERHEDGELVEVRTVHKNRPNRRRRS